MADDQNPAGGPQSKRERQKARRSAKREQEAKQAATARRNRAISIGLVVVVALGLTGFALRGPAQRFLNIREARANAEALQAEHGCTPIEEIPGEGGQHFAPQQLAENPPEEAYEARPAVSGIHMGQVATTGIYTEVVDERLIIHNLEHGYINVLYTEDAPTEQIEAVESWANGTIGANQKLIVTPFMGEMDNDATIALTAWDFRQLCDTFSESLADLFVNEHHYFAGRAPERTLPPHLQGGGGVLDPEEVDGPLLFPPLGEGVPGISTDTMESAPQPEDGEEPDILDDGDPDAEVDDDGGADADAADPGADADDADADDADAADVDDADADDADEDDTDADDDATS